jgi:predicted permease
VEYGEVPVEYKRSTHSGVSLPLPHALDLEATRGLNYLVLQLLKINYKMVYQNIFRVAKSSDLTKSLLIFKSTGLAACLLS